MIFFDVTKTGGAGHRSGLTRVSARLLDGLGPAAEGVRWFDWDRHVRKDDWFFTSELFSEEERPGIGAFLDAHACRTAALFHDAIPLKHPHITWPQSVARHPGYMKLLGRFDRVWAVSAASRDELLGFWRWQGLERIPPIDVLPPGADFNGAPRVSGSQLSTLYRARQGDIRHSQLHILSLGIIEPRKNQNFLLSVCRDLWSSGLEFDLHLVGRVNPHFGGPIAERILALSRDFSGLHFHEAADDATVARLYAKARATAFPTIAEGCGLPLLESLWMGVPCVCSDLPVLRENSGGGGCVAVTPNDRAAWSAALRRVLTDDAHHAQLCAEATRRPLPTWSEAAEVLKHELR